jgi:hypothetical protein
MHPDTEARLAGIAKGLLSRTQRGSLDWQETDVDDAFVASTDSASVRIVRTYDRDGDPHFLLSIFNPAGREMEALHASQWNDEAHFHLLSDVFEYARRNAMDIEGVLSALLVELDSVPLLPAPKVDPVYGDEEPF